jgi:hypothetical protein
VPSLENLLQNQPFGLFLFFLVVYISYMVSVNKSDSAIKAFSSKNTVKFQILNLLTSEYNLKAKQIHSRLSRKGCKTSYQATFKALNQLFNEGVVEKNDYGFRISLSWISSLKGFIKNIEVHYSDDNDPLRKILLASKSSGNCFVNVFNSIKEMDEFLFSFISNENGFCAFVRHPWFPLIHAQEIANYSSEPKDEKVVFSSNETQLDKDCMRFLKKIGEQVVPCNETTSNFSFSIYGDYVVQAFFDKEITDYLDSVFTKYKKIRDIDLVEFNKNFFEKTTKIPVTIIYNPALAKSLKNWLFSL